MLTEPSNYATRRGHTRVIRNMFPHCARLIQLYNQRFE